MAVVSIFASVAVVAAGITSVQGMYLQQERYPIFYGKDLTRHNFWSDKNPVWGADPDSRTNTLEPSGAEITLIDRIDFMQRSRPVETRIFSGTIDVSGCQEGKYLFRLTSDDSAHMFINRHMIVENNGVHAPTQKTGKVSLKRGRKYDFQLWWGNYGGPAMAKLEFCNLSGGLAGAEDDQQSELRGIEDGVEDVMEELLETATDEELAARGCVFSTDLSKIFEKPNLPTIKREDFDGYHWEDKNFWETAKVETKWLPSGYAAEMGGVITAHTHGKGPENAERKSFVYTTPIAARVTGVHTFWVESDDGAYLAIDGVTVVNNGNTHAAIWRSGKVYLTAGERRVLKVYYGNDAYSGKLTVRWQDQLSDQPLDSLLPIMVV